MKLDELAEAIDEARERLTTEDRPDEILDMLRYAAEFVWEAEHALDAIVEAEAKAEAEAEAG